MTAGVVDNASEQKPPSGEMTSKGGRRKPVRPLYGSIDLSEREGPAKDSISSDDVHLLHAISVLEMLHVQLAQLHTNKKYQKRVRKACKKGLEQSTCFVATSAGYAELSQAQRWLEDSRAQKHGGKCSKDKFLAPDPPPARPAPALISCADLSFDAPPVEYAGFMEGMPAKVEWAEPEETPMETCEEAAEQSGGTEDASPPPGPWLVAEEREDSFQLHYSADGDAVQLQ